MSTSVIERQITSLQDNRADLIALAEGIVEAAATAERDLTPDEHKNITDAQQRIAGIDAQIKPLAEFHQRKISAMDVQHLFARQQSAAHQQPEQRQGPLSLGAFVDSAEYRSWDGRGRSGIAELELRVSELRAPLLETTTPGSLLLPSAPRYVLPQGQLLTPLLNAMPKLPVSSNAVDLVVYGAPTGAVGAAVVAEGQTKPEATITASIVNQTVPTIAHYLKFSRQLAMDAPAARSLIDDQLQRGLLNKLESLAAAAVGGGTYAATTGASKQPLIEVVRMAQADLQALGYRPNVLLIAPADAAAFDILLMNKTLLGAMAGQGIWGLEVIPVPGLAKTIVADSTQAFLHVERTGAQVYVSDSDSTDFTKNLLTALVECRAVTVVTQAAAARSCVVTP